MSQQIDNSKAATPEPIPDAVNARPEPGVAPLRINRRQSLGRLLRRIGPGLIAGASDDDPSAVGTYVVAGASLGYATLWTAFFTLPMMIAIQYISAKIGLVTHQGLGRILRDHYPRYIAYIAVLALLIVNTLTVGVDIGAMAAAVHILFPIAIPLLILGITLIILALQVFGSYKSLSRLFKWLTLAFLTYVGAAFVAHPDLSEVLHATFIPTIRLDANFIAMLVALFGQALTPYMFFWQADEEAEEKRMVWRKVSRWKTHKTSDAELHYAFLDTTVGMIVSNLVMYFIILATGATLFKAGHTNVQSAADAAQALQPIAGNAAGALFAVGLIGAGFLGVPVMTGSAAYAVSQVLGWRYGLDEPVQNARNFYGVIIVATVIGILINFLNLNPIDALFWVSVISGLMAPPLLVMVMLISNNRQIMGNRVNRRGPNLLGCATTLVMFIAAGGMIVLWLTGKH